MSKCGAGIMKRSMWVALGVAGALAIAGRAAATTYYDITLAGYLTAQGGGPDDANLHVGDKLTLTARISDAYVVQNFGGFGYDLAASWLNGQRIPTTGATFWRIDGGGLTWGSDGDELDGAGAWYSLNQDPFGFIKDLAGPGIAFENGKVVAFGSNRKFYPAGPTAPGITMASIGSGHEHFACTDPYCVGPMTHTATFTEASYDPNFGLYTPYLYSNNRYTPGFVGFWDFA